VLFGGGVLQLAVVTVVLHYQISAFLHLQHVNSADLRYRSKTVTSVESSEVIYGTLCVNCSLEII